MLGTSCTSRRGCATLDSTKFTKVLIVHTVPSMLKIQAALSCMEEVSI